MKFKSMTEEEIQSLSLLPEGIYAFEVINAFDAVSKKNNNEMIKIHLKIWDFNANGKEYFIFDYLLASFPLKLKHFCDSTGLIEKYEIGEISASDCINKTGSIEIYIQKGQKNPNGVNYPDKNSVKDYIKIKKERTEIINEKNDSFDDAVPF